MEQDNNESFFASKSNRQLVGYTILLLIFVPTILTLFGVMLPSVFFWLNWLSMVIVGWLGIKALMLWMDNGQ